MGKVAFIPQEIAISCDKIKFEGELFLLEQIALKHAGGALPRVASPVSRVVEQKTGHKGPFLTCPLHDATLVGTLLLPSVKL